MSPTLIQDKGYRVVMYLNDHLPAHVHVKKDRNEVRVQIDPVQIMDNWGYNQREIKAILELITTHQEQLLAAWNTFYPPETKDKE